MPIQVLINPTYVDGELFLVQTVGTFICQDAETVAASNVATYFTKNMYPHELQAFILDFR